MRSRRTVQQLKLELRKQTRLATRSEKFKELLYLSLKVVDAAQSVLPHEEKLKFDDALGNHKYSELVQQILKSLEITEEEWSELEKKYGNDN